MTPGEPMAISLMLSELIGPTTVFDQPAQAWAQAIELGGKYSRREGVEVKDAEERARRGVDRDAKDEVAATGGDACRSVPERRADDEVVDAVVVEVTGGGYGEASSVAQGRAFKLCARNTDADLRQRDDSRFPLTVVRF